MVIPTKPLTSHSPSSEKAKEYQSHDQPSNKIYLHARYAYHNILYYDIVSVDVYIVYYVRLLLVT